MVQLSCLWVWPKDHELIMRAELVTHVKMQGCCKYMQTNSSHMHGYLAVICTVDLTFYKTKIILEIGILIFNCAAVTK